MKYKLLFVVNVDWFFLSHRLPIALEALRQGYEVHIATALTDKISVLQGHGLVVHPLSLDRSDAGLWSAWALFRQIHRICKDIKPDVVHIMANGRIVKTGGPELALEVENNGYSEILAEVA